MKILTTLLVVLMTSTGFAQSSGPKPQKIVDVVFKIQKIDEKSMISFYRAPTIYEVTGDTKGASDLLALLEKSQKTQKPVQVTVDNRTRKILEVKEP